MTKNLPLPEMHFMAQRVRAAGAGIAEEDCSRPLAQGRCGGIPHVQDFLRLLAQSAVLSAVGFYNFCAEELLLLRMPTGEETGEGRQLIYDRLAWGGMAVPIPAVRHRRPDDTKKR